MPRRFEIRPGGRDDPGRGRGQDRWSSGAGAPSLWEEAEPSEGAQGADRAASETLACRVCGREVRVRELDHLGRCEECREAARRRIGRGARIVALLVTVPFAGWILIEGTGGLLPPYAWLIPLAAAYYLGLRIGREVFRGIERARLERTP